MMKYNIDKKKREGGYMIYDKSSEQLISIGDIRLYKCRLKNYSFSKKKMTRNRKKDQKEQAPQY